MNFNMKGHMYTRKIRTSLQFPDGKIIVFFEPDDFFENEFITIFADEQETLPLKLTQFAESLIDD